MTKTMRKAWQFFMENAGYCTPPGRAACALELAKAEQWAKGVGVKVEWMWDDAGCSGCDCGSEACLCASGADHETLGCVLTFEGQTESLWGICGATPEYRRVVEAELAQDMRVNFLTAIVNRIQQL